MTFHKQPQKRVKGRRWRVKFWGHILSLIMVYLDSSLAGTGGRCPQCLSTECPPFFSMGTWVQGGGELPKDMKLATRQWMETHWIRIQYLLCYLILLPWDYFPCGKPGTSRREARRGLLVATICVNILSGYS